MEIHVVQVECTQLVQMDTGNGEGEGKRNQKEKQAATDTENRVKRKCERMKEENRRKNE